MTVIAQRIGLVLAGGLAGGLLIGAPAWAHAADAPAGTNYRTEVTGVTPAVDGVTVRVIEAGARLELTNRTGRTIEVLGYAGEPYLEIRPDGVYENTHSPATYLNQTLTGETEPPADADPTRPPTWQRVTTEPVARWHDQRTYWLDSAFPEQVVADPDRVHRIRDWVVPLRDGTTEPEIRGTLDWLPPPDPLAWWAVSVLAALLVGTLGLPPLATRVGRIAVRTLAALCAAGGIGAVGFAVAWAFDAGAVGPVDLLSSLLTGQIWPVLAGLGAVAAAGYALARRPAGDFALALAGGCLALFAGATNALVFARSVAPVPGSALWARVRGRHADRGRCRSGRRQRAAAEGHPHGRGHGLVDQGIPRRSGSCCRGSVIQV